MSRFDLVVVDGDDTLWETMALYRAAKLAFSGLLQRKGFDGPGALAMLEAIDLRNGTIYGFSSRRFPESMAETYRCLARESKQDPSPRVTEEARSIARAVFDQTPRLVDGVHEVLSHLAKQHPLVLCTKGDRAVQEARVASSGLASYFARIYIPPTKGNQEFARILSDAGVEAASAISVGDSLRADINPAIEVGMSAIWVPTEHWLHEDAPQAESERLFRASTLRLVPVVLERIEDEQRARRSA